MEPKIIPFYKPKNDQFAGYEDPIDPVEDKNPELDFTGYEDPIDLVEDKNPELDYNKQSYRKLNLDDVGTDGGDYVKRSAVNMENVDMAEANTLNLIDTLKKEFPLKQAQIETAKAIARHFGHLWSRNEVYQEAQNMALEAGMTVRGIESEAIEVDKHGYTPSKHLAPKVTVDEDGKIVLWDETQSRRYQWYVYEDGSYKIDISKRDSESPTYGTIVLSVKGGSIGDANVVVKNSDFQARHVFCLKEALEIGGCNPSDIDRKIEGVVLMLNDSEKKEYARELASPVFFKLEEGIDEELRKIANDLFTKHKAMGVAVAESDLRVAFDERIKLFCAKLSETYGDENANFEDVLGVYEKCRHYDDSTTHVLWEAISGNYAQLMEDFNTSTKE